MLSKKDCEFCEGIGLLGFQRESCWFCGGKGWVEKNEINDNDENKTSE